MPVGVVISQGKLPIKCWMSQAELDIQPGAVEQALSLANHPIVEKWVGLMPDAHQGYGMPIGGVIATSGGVIPYGIGLDIGCGIVAVETSLEAGSLSREKLEKIRVEIHARVPVGDSHHKEAPVSFDSMCDPAGSVTRRFLDQGRFSLGTLGGGNHFIELQADEEDRVWIMLHSGSRNMGAQVCKFYHNEAKALMLQFHSELPKAENGKPITDLAFLPKGIPLYDQYLAEMAWCLQFAEDSRERMLHCTYEAIASVIDDHIGPVERIETHHNFAAMEHWGGKNVLVHRKGAVKAVGLVTIPGSMGTASYIGRGLNNPESFGSCAHGAGRILGRKQANLKITHEQAVESMKHVVYGVRQGSYDEMPAAYKDVDRVMANQDDLVEAVHRLTPLAVVKG